MLKKETLVLKTCPAGHENVKYVSELDYCRNTVYYILCLEQKCRWEGPKRKTVRGAINAWNRRHDHVGHTETINFRGVCVRPATVGSG